MVVSVSKVGEIHVSGPLAPFVEGFKEHLAATGYTPLTIVNEVRLVETVSRWLAEHGWTVTDLTRARSVEFIAARRVGGFRWALTPGSFRALFEFLDGLGVRSAEPAPPPLSPVDALLESFRLFLLGERALTVRTATSYAEGIVRPFLIEHAADGNVAALTSAVVIAAVRDRAARLAVATTQRFVCGLRAFLRFCFMTGRTATDLSGAALAITGRPQSFLPRGISRHDADLLLGSCSGQRRCDRRDYAVLLLLLRLGLRAGEVIGLTLDDIDWRAGEITVRGKGPRIERLPLPCDVGEAIAAYLEHERPVTACRVVFVTALAPIRPLGGSTITQIVRHGCVRAGIAPVGAHRLRHTMACEMTAAGVPLPEIGQVLRHRQLHSTSIYARVDIERLRQLALAWPGGDRDE